MQPIQGMPLECPALVARASGPHRTSYTRPLLQDWRRQLFGPIHRNKHRELLKMRRQRNMSQMKEQDKTSEKDLNEMEISNPPDKEFKVMVIKMLPELGRIDEHSRTSTERLKI